MIPLLYVLFFCGKKFTLSYLIINYIIAMVIYFKATKNYFPRMKADKSVEGVKFSPNQNFHEDYLAFGRTELNSISFVWIYYGMLNYFWIKTVLTISMIIITYLVM